MTQSIKAGLEDNAKRMERLADLALDTAKKIGCDHAKISTGASFQKRLVVENKVFTLANSLESRSLGILVFKDNKKGSASINTVTEDGVKKAVADALALATFSVPDDALTLPDRDLAPKAKALPFLFDDALAEVELAEIQATMQEVLARLTRDPRIALDRYEMSVDVSYHGLANSHGVRQTERQSMGSWSFFGMGRDGEEVTGFDYDGSFSFTRGDMLARSMRDAETFEAKLLSALGPGKAPSYRGPVLFSPRAVQELLLGMILYHAGGAQVMDGKSRWDKSLGKKVLSPLISLHDRPHDPRFSGATSFDSDGVPTRPQAIVDKGVLMMHLHNCYTAKRTGTQTTASGGGPFACDVAAGHTPLAEALKARDQLLVVDRFSGNSDPVKGDFSGVAKSSRLYKGGKDAGPVSETMIAGNFFELADAVLGVTDVAENVGGGFMSPYVLVDGVSVTGGEG